MRSVVVCSALLTGTAWAGWLAASEAQAPSWGAAAAGLTALFLWTLLAARTRGDDLRAGLVAVPLIVGAGLGAAGAMPVTATAGGRGLGAGIVEARVRGGAHAGERCMIEVELGGVAQTLSVARSECDFGHGDRLAVPVDALVRAAEAARPLALAGHVPREDAATILLDHVHVRGRAAGLRAAGTRWLARVRGRARTLASDRPRAFVVAISAGVRGAIHREDARALRRSGLSHLLAISGLHVTLLASLLFACVAGRRRLDGARGTAALMVASVGALCFVALAGARAPATRALLLWAAGAVVPRLGGRLQPLGALLGCATIMVLVEPTWLADVGFQLSFVAVAAIVLPEHARRVEPEGAASPLWRSFGASLRATWATTPLVVWHFGAAPIAGVLVNVIAIPIVSLWILPAGWLGLSLAPWLGDRALAPAAVGADLVLAVAEVARGLPLLGRQGWACVAGIVLVLALAKRAVDMWRAPAGPPRAPSRPRAWLWLAAIATLAAAWQRPRSIEVDGALWLGRPGAALTITTLPDGHACLDASAASEHDVIAWLRMAGPTHVDLVGPAGPAGDALRDAVEDLGIAVREDARCPVLRADPVEMRRCARMRGGRAALWIRPTDAGARRLCALEASLIELSAPRADDSADDRGAR